MKRGRTRSTGAGGGGRAGAGAGGGDGVLVLGGGFCRERRRVSVLSAGQSGHAPALMAAGRRGGQRYARRELSPCTARARKEACRSPLQRLGHRRQQSKYWLFVRGAP